MNRYRFEIIVIIALGRPAEEISLEEIGGNGDIRYWRDSKNIHHVPKRPLDEIIIGRAVGRIFKKS
ncbi:MAG: hypothetical protein WC364_02600 [Eubacteriales bacterium]